MMDFISWGSVVPDCMMVGNGLFLMPLRRSRPSPSGRLRSRMRAAILSPSLSRVSWNCLMFSMTLAV